MAVNKWIGIGNLTRDPELKYTPAGVAVCNFSLACNERWTDKNGEKQESVEFVNIVVWRGLAEVCGKFLHKGKEVYIEGKLTTRSYEGNDGTKKYVTEIVAKDMQMVGGKGDSKPDSSGSQTYQRPAQQQASPQNTGTYDPNDEIPF